MPEAAARLERWRSGRDAGGDGPRCSTRCAPCSTTTSTRPGPIAAIDAAADAGADVTAAAMLLGVSLAD